MAKMTQWPARIVLVGSGKMGGAMALGWLDGGLSPSSLTILEPSPSDAIAQLAASRAIALNPAECAPPDVLVLAVKPQSLDAAAARIAQVAKAPTLVLSILAGKTIADIKARLPEAGAIVRAMPNTPAAIGRGVTAAFASPEVTRGTARLERASVRRGRRSSIGSSNESEIDAVTAISGSGPAYVFALTEALAAAAEKLGLSAELSMSLARGTVEGSGELMRRGKRNAARDLRRNVTSPGGTTAAALAVLQ